MARASIDSLLHFHPSPIFDPAPEIFRIIDELSLSQRVAVIDVINQQRAKLDQVRAVGHAEITKALTHAVGKG